MKSPEELAFSVCRFHPFNSKSPEPPSYCGSCQCIAAVIRKDREEMKEKYIKLGEQLRDDPMLIGKDAWEIGRIGGFDSFIDAIRRLKVERE